MKTRMILLCVAALLTLGGLSSVQAQSSAYELLYEFTATSGSDSNNIDGAIPEAALVLSGSTLYATAGNGGSAGNGTIFSINTNGSDFTNMYSFSAGGANNLGALTNSDGAQPLAGLVLAGNILYGTTASGGTGGSGTVFRINTDGLDFTNLHSFTATSGSPFFANGDGANPVASLVLAGNTLYGTAQNGGNAGNGTVFKINTDGSDFSIVYSFSQGNDDQFGTYTNSDGAIPFASLILSGNTLFGMAEYGGVNGSGTVFSVNVGASDFTNLYSFSGTTYDPNLELYENNDGAFPISGLILSSNTLYGTAEGGGEAGTGTVFSLETNSLVFTTLYTFSAPNLNTIQGDYTNTDGFFPVAPLLLSGTTLYGTTENGGSGDVGTVFSLNTDGSGFTNLYNFSTGQTNASDLYTNIGGAVPVAALILSGYTLYGTAAFGGNQGDGTVFALSLPAPPSLAIAASNHQISISWPAASTYVLQTATNLLSGSWSVISSGITTVGTSNVFVGPASGQAAFFRLQQQ